MPYLELSFQTSSSCHGSKLVRSTNCAQTKLALLAVLSDSVQLVVSRQLLQLCAQELRVLPPEAQKLVAQQ